MTFIRERFAKWIAVMILLSTACALTGPVAAQETPFTEIRVPLDMDEPRALVHVEANDRIVVVGDDEAQIVSSAGEILFRIGGMAGANDVDVAGNLAVVSAPSTGELVVIDTDTGVVVKRILAGAQGVSSVSVVGDLIWYAHGPDQWDAGIGRASITEGTATPGLVAYPVYAGSVIDVSPARPQTIYMTRARVGPSNIFRVEISADGTTEYLRNPYHSSFHPFVVSEDGETVWALNEGNVLEMDPDDLTKSGLFYENMDPPSSRRTFRSPTVLASHNNELLAFAHRGFVATYRVGIPAVSAVADFNEPIMDVDLDSTRLFTLTGPMSVEHGGTTSSLTISGFERSRPDRRIVFAMYGYGTPPTARPTYSYTCNDGTNGTFFARYEWTYSVMVSADATSCSVTRSIEPRVVASSFAANDDQWSSGVGHLEISAFAAANNPPFLHLLDQYESPATSMKSFVELQYHDILNRAPDQGGVQYWTGQLTQGRISPAGYVESLVDSPEYLGSIAPVTRLYLAYFDRVPDDAGLLYWLTRYRAGASLDSISLQFARSDEFKRTYGSVTDREFLSLVYGNVLGRQPDEGGYRYWLGRMSDGMTRGSVMTAFSESPEYIEGTNPAIVVRSIYHGLLRREPDQAGFAYWIEQYRGGRSLQGMIDGFLQSGEYINRFWIEDPGTAALLHESADEVASRLPPTPHPITPGH